MSENELEILLLDAYENHNYDKVIELFENNKSLITKKYHSLNLKYIESLYNNGEYNKSIELIQEELSMPYIPMEYEDGYKALYTLCLNSLKNRDFEKISHFSDEEIINEVFVKESNMSLIILAYLEDKNVRKFLPHIRDYFKNENKQNYIKVFLMDVLKKQEVSEDFVINSKVGSRVINPLTTHYFDEQVVLSEVFAKMNNEIKDITLLEIMKEISIGLCIGLFPHEFKLDDINAIVAACYYNASSMLNNPVSIDRLKNMYECDDERLYLFLDILKNDSKEVSC